MSMEGGENYEPPRFFLRVHCCATLQSAVEATVDLHYKMVCFNQLFVDVNIFSIV